MNKADRDKLKEFKTDVEHLVKNYQDAVEIYRNDPKHEAKSYTAGYLLGKKMAYALVAEEFTKRELA